MSICLLVTLGAQVTATPLPRWTVRQSASPPDATRRELRLCSPPERRTVLTLMPVITLHVLPPNLGLSTAFELDVTYEAGRGTIAGSQVSNLLRLFAKLPRDTSFDLEWERITLSRCRLGQPSPDGAILFTFETVEYPNE